jgi:diguanylate cyclase (GGDEF)-like protein
MRHTGRIIALIVAVVVFLIIRIWAYYRYDFPFTSPPILALICFFTAWWLGKQYDQVKYYSEKDVLTGLYNRRYVYDGLPMLLAQVARRNATLSIAILDCNNFKAINDNFGHKKGDLVLQDLSAILATSIRKNDIAARWGGDEFLIIAPYADKKDIEEIVACFKHELQALSEKLRVEVSVSAGYAVYPEDTTSAAGLITIADSAMYSLKNGTCATPDIAAAG